MIANLVLKTQLLTDVYRFEFKPSKPINWQAGQFIKYTLPHVDPDERGINRWFTISAAPYESIIAITTRFDYINGSTFKKALLGLEINSAIEINQPAGEFLLTDRQVINYVFIAGGIGITPFIAMFRQLLYEHKNLICNLLYANKDENFVFKQELDETTQHLGGLNIKYIPAPHRITQTEVANAAAENNSTLYYISGPKPMVQSYKEMIVALGIKEKCIKLDSFPGYEHV